MMLGTIVGMTDGSFDGLVLGGDEGFPLGTTVGSVVGIGEG